MNRDYPTDEKELKEQFSQTSLPPIDVTARVLGAQRMVQINHKGLMSLRGKRLAVAGCSVLLVMAVLGIMMSFSASAERVKRIPVVGKLFEGDIFSFAGDNGVKKGKALGLSMEMNEEATDNGVTIRIDDVLYDGTRLSLGYLMRSEQPNLMFLEDIELRIDGELRTAGFTSKPRKINDYESAGVLELKLNERSDSFIVALSIGQVSSLEGEQPHRLPGIWSFELPVTNQALSSTVHHRMTEGNRVKAGKAMFEVTDVILTPITSRIDFRYVGDTEWLGFQLMDEQGMLVEASSLEYGENNEGIVSGTMIFSPIDLGSRLLYVTPYQLKIDRRTEDQRMKKAELATAFPIILQQGKVGEVSVNDVEFLPDKTLIHYEVRGSVPYMQYASLWLETAEGDRIISDNGKRTRVREDSYSYVLEYPALDAKAKYVLGTMEQTEIELQEKLRLKLELHD
ncbi:DUF4179 domain-containing protein [Paenibacillus luteus]|uniref:DUF4179 domain-containing protein n=1 Tax=Paenibacillus luteus TaxID=2545753 RepID=UPI001375774F|nr:DUF4179 domain-containing protein [Paenibacillus luteus]